jgi:hypothetical protein
MLHSRRLLQILGGHASQAVQDQHQRVIELVRSGSAGGTGPNRSEPVLMALRPLFVSGPIKLAI